MEEVEPKPVTPEIVENDKKSDRIGVWHNAKGQFAVGNPGKGRPKGLLNKYTLMKKDLLDAWKNGGGKKRFLELMNGSDADFKWCVERLVMILPKESTVDIDSSGPTVVFQFVKNEKTIEVVEKGSLNNPPLQKEGNSHGENQ